jgi:general secretion pathway protein K
MKQQGIALIQVLLITAILSVLAIYLTNTARNQLTIAQWANDKTQAIVNVHSAEAKLMFTLLTESKKYPRENIDHSNAIVRLWNFHGQAFSIGENVNISIQDQSGLMYAYKPNSKRLTHLLLAHGLTAKKAEHIIASLRDWQDLDNIPQFSGNESASYGYPIRNGKVVDLHEFSYVANVSSTTLALLTENLSLYKQASFNPMVAPRAVLQAFFKENDLNEVVVDEVNRLRSAGKLTKAIFTEVTEIKENDEQEINFNITNTLSIKLKSTVGESSITKKLILNFNPYVTKENRPINIYSNRG